MSVNAKSPTPEGEVSHSNTSFLEMNMELMRAIGLDTPEYRAEHFQASRVLSEIKQTRRAKANKLTKNWTAEREYLMKVSKEQYPNAL